ncbi:MAG: hypothetical protein KGZ65_15870 [Sphingomonadales bacterium]|nr:hypothetical protein [Sphingomonadaceae bacterium]MBS3932701.1 hypothetical protein [Sphingomonadales bacterium]
MSILASALLLLGAEGAVYTNQAILSEPNPKAMSQKEIREFNARLPKNHPFYIRCVKSDETGSIAKKLYSCRTNRQWGRDDATGNQNARDTMDAMTSKFWNTD